MIQSVKHLVTNNWLLKVFSVALATMLWMTIASETSSEIGLDVPLEYRNIPPELELTGDTTSTVHLRLRGSPNLIKDISPRDVSTVLDLRSMTPGEKIIPLTAQNVDAPFGAEVVRVSPSSVRFSLERTTSRLLRVVPTIQGEPANGYKVGEVSLTPPNVQVEGPESRVNLLDSVPTLPIPINEKKETMVLATEVDIPDPDVRIRSGSQVNVRVEILPN